MATRESPADRGRRRIDQDLRLVASESHRARIGAGLSLRAVGAATRIDHVRIWRFENGALNALSVAQLGSICGVIGLDLRLRAYPAGDAVRDVGQSRLAERLRRKLHSSLRWRTEVALPIEGDLRAWDAVISGRGWSLPVEAETVLTDIQAVERRLALKCRDGGVDHVLLLVADTRRNRAAVASAPAAFSALDGRPRDVLGALRAGRDPGASGIVFL
jgi:transcriptional regulator with XRE-family HTH domain